jgi:hypothetical protein
MLSPDGNVEAVSGRARFAMDYDAIVRIERRRPWIVVGNDCE